MDARGFGLGASDPSQGVLKGWRHLGHCGSWCVGDQSMRRPVYPDPIKAQSLRGKRTLEIVRGGGGTAGASCRIAMLVCISVSCSRSPETVAVWRELLRSSPECTTTHLLLSTWPPQPVNSPPGELHLPATFRSVRTDSTETLWVGMDSWVGMASSEVAYVVSPEPSSAMAGQSPLMSRLRRPSYRRERVCRLKVAGNDALIDTFQQVDSAKTDTVFGLAATVATNRRRFVEVLALTPRAAMRDSLFAAVASLEWR